MRGRVATFCFAALWTGGCTSPAPPPVDLPAPGTPPTATAPPATSSSALAPAANEPRASEPPERRGDGVDLVHVVCTLDARAKPMRAQCAEAPANAPRPAPLAKCDQLTRRPATPGTMRALTDTWKAAAPMVSNGGAPLRPAAMVSTPRDMPRPASVGGRPALMLVDMRLLGRRHAQHRAAGCDNPPPDTGCDPVAVGHGALVPAEAKGSVQMVSQGFLGVGRCTGP
ncbi:MAG: hypothetical protein RIF41_18330 [Polyangiaceae bacterium]